MKEFNIQIDNEDLSKQTNNYDLRLIEDSTWEHELTKSSLITLIDETPIRKDIWVQSLIIFLMVSAMIFFYRLAVETTLVEFEVLFWGITSLVAIFIMLTVNMAIRHINRFRKVKKRVYACVPQPLQSVSETKLNHVVNLFFGMVVFLGAMGWLLYPAGLFDVVLLILVGWLILEAFHARYKRTYFYYHIGYLVHHIQKTLQQQME